MRIAIPQEVIDYMTISSLVEAREVNLEDIQRLGPAYDRLNSAGREDFKHSMEFFHAADVMLRYFTTNEHYQALVA